MKCPKCGGQLQEEKQDSIVINRCDACAGIWMDYPELSQIEDTVWNEDDAKGELEFNENQSDLRCPQCNDQMVKFNYRYSDLVLDTCPKMHGFWLDNGEEKRIKAIMKEDKADYERKIEAESEWTKTLGRMQSKGFIEKVRTLLKL